VDLVYLVKSADCEYYFDTNCAELIDGKQYWWCLREICST